MSKKINAQQYNSYANDYRGVTGDHARVILENVFTHLWDACDEFLWPPLWVSFL
jgi:hypothetical protein